MAELVPKRADPDQTLHNAASDLSLHCLSFNIFGVSSPDLNGLWVAYFKTKFLC